MKIRISATEAARQFSELLNRVHYRRESFIIARGGSPVCELIPAVSSCTLADLVNLLGSLRKPDTGYLRLTEELITTQPDAADSPWPH